jgi:hypothetical protein
VTKTASITHYLKNSWAKFVGLIAFACLVWSGAGPVWAQATAPEISRFRLERAGDSVLLSAELQFELPTAVEEALLKGVAVVFVAETEVTRERWYWMNKKVVSTERHMRLAFQPLTRRWRLNVAPGLMSNTGLGVALNQTFDSLTDALAAVQRLSRWKIADFGTIDLERRHWVDFRFRLDASQLPRPLQIGTLGQSEWNISMSYVQPLVLETGK